MKKQTLFIGSSLLAGVAAYAALHGQHEAMTETRANKIADAIFKIENSKIHPYGIMIKTNNPRKVCLNTIKNTFARWEKAGSPGNIQYR